MIRTHAHIHMHTTRW